MESMPTIPCSICGIGLPTMHKGTRLVLRNNRRYCRKCLTLVNRYRTRVSITAPHAVHLIEMGEQLIREGLKVIENTPGIEMGIRFETHKRMWDLYDRYRGLLSGS